MSEIVSLPNPQHLDQAIGQIDEDEQHRIALTQAIPVIINQFADVEGGWVHMQMETQGLTQDELIAEASQAEYSETAVGFWWEHAISAARRRAEVDPTNQEQLKEDIGLCWGLVEDFADTDEGSQMYSDVYELVRQFSVNPESDVREGDIRDPILFFASVELAQVGDFESARKALQELGSSKLRADLESKLAEAEMALPHGFKVSEEESKSFLQDLTEQHYPVSTAERAKQQESEVTNIRVAVNTDVVTVGRMFDPLSDGRYATYLESSTGGGFSDPEFRRKQSGTVGRNTTFDKIRRKTEKALGVGDNIYLPRLVYGAVTSDAEPLGGAPEYGDVELVLKDDVIAEGRVSFTSDDSIEDMKKNGAKGINLLRQEDAEVAYRLMLASRGQEGVSPAGVYTEAQISRFGINDIEEVRMLINTRPGVNLDSYMRAAQLVIDHDVPLTIVLEDPEMSEELFNWLSANRKQGRVINMEVQLHPGNLNSSEEQYEELVDYYKDRPDVKVRSFLDPQKPGADKSTELRFKQSKVYQRLNAPVT